MSFRSNLRPRLRLLRNALTRRFVYADVVAMAIEYGVEYRDTFGDVQPFEFARQLMAGAASDPPPDFGSILGRPESFIPPGAPASFNSEASVGRFLGELVFHKRARTVVELGCFVGWTSAHMALGLHARGDAGCLWCVDYMQEYLDATMANLKRYHLELLAHTVCGFSLDAMVMEALPREIDVLFIDTSHGYPATRDEVLAYAPRLTSHGCIVLHDSLSAVGVRRSIAELASKFRALTFATEGSNGVTVLLPRS